MRETKGRKEIALATSQAATCGKRKSRSCRGPRSSPSTFGLRVAPNVLFQRKWRKTRVGLSNSSRTGFPPTHTRSPATSGMGSCWIQASTNVDTGPREISVSPEEFPLVFCHASGGFFYASLRHFCRSLRHPAESRKVPRAVLRSRGLLSLGGEKGPGPALIPKTSWPRTPKPSTKRPTVNQGATRH
jgi:hypothetical protein